MERQLRIISVRLHFQFILLSQQSQLLISGLSNKIMIRLHPSTNNRLAKTDVRKCKGEPGAASDKSATLALSLSRISTKRTKLKTSPCSVKNFISIIFILIFPSAVWWNIPGKYLHDALWTDRFTSWDRIPSRSNWSQCANGSSNCCDKSQDHHKII